MSWPMQIVAPTPRFPSYQVSTFPTYQVSKFPSFQGGREEGPMRGLATNHVISGPLRGLKKLHLMTQTNRHTDMATV